MSLTLLDLVSPLPDLPIIRSAALCVGSDSKARSRRLGLELPLTLCQGERRRQIQNRHFERLLLALDSRPFCRPFGLAPTPRPPSPGPGARRPRSPSRAVPCPIPPALSARSAPDRCPAPASSGDQRAPRSRARGDARLVSSAHCARIALTSCLAGPSPFFEPVRIRPFDRGLGPQSGGGKLAAWWSRCGRDGYAHRRAGAAHELRNPPPPRSDWRARRRTPGRARRAASRSTHAAVQPRTPAPPARPFVSRRPRRHSTSACRSRAQLMSARAAAVGSTISACSTPRLRV